MSDNDKRNAEQNDNLDPSNQTGSYVLGGLDADEVTAFEKQLAENADLRAEVTELGDTAVMLGLAVTPEAPPASLKASIMDQLDATTQRAAEVPAASAPAGPVPAAPVPGPIEARAQRRWSTRPVVALVSAAAVIGILAGGGVIATSVFQNGERQEQADLLAAINAADDVQRRSVPLSDGAATLVWSNELLASALIVDGLESLPADKVYELWYIGEEGARSAGTFTADGTRTWRVLDGDMQAGDVVGVTVEPRGGSEQPTTDPIIKIESA